jgi:ABC-type cobalt transport system substrate-binding protein
MTMYVYDTDTREVVAEITGADNAACEAVVADRFGDTDYFASTYTPAFGAVDGLIQCAADVERIAA